MTLGSFAMVSGSPSAIFLPESSTITRSLTFITSSITCSINITVTPMSSCTCLMSAMISSISLGFNPAATSSNRSSLGSDPRAVAIVTRFWAATVSSLTLNSERSCRFRSFKISLARALAREGERVRIKHPTITFSSTLRSPEATYT